MANFIPPVNGASQCNYFLPKSHKLDNDNEQLLIMVQKTHKIKESSPACAEASCE